MRIAGKYNKLMDLLSAITPHRASSTIKKQYPKQPWVVTVTNVYIEFTTGRKRETNRWTGAMNEFYTLYKKAIAKKNIESYGLEGFFEVSESVHQWKKNQFKRVGQWQEQIWSREMGEVKVETTIDTTDVYQVITDKVLAMLETKQQVPWHKPWDMTHDAPTNLFTKKQYKGANVFMLGLFSEFQSNLWISKKQAEMLKGQINPDQLDIYTEIVYWNWNFKDRITKEKVFKRGDEYVTEKGRAVNQVNVIKVPYLRYYKVYNAEQTMGLDEHINKFEAIKSTKGKGLNKIQRCEKIVENYIDKPRIKASNVAAYIPATDVLTMPNIKAFDDSQSYYSVLFHEFIHSTGHKSRLNRAGVMQSDGKGGELYQREELCAELGACYLRAMSGINNKKLQDNSVEYIRGWSKALREDKTLFIAASQQAQKAVEHMNKVKTV